MTTLPSPSANFAVSICADTAAFRRGEDEDEAPRPVQPCLQLQESSEHPNWRMSWWSPRRSRPAVISPLLSFSAFLFFSPRSLVHAC